MCRTSTDTPRSGGGGTTPPMKSHVATQHGSQTVVYAIIASITQRHTDKVRPRRGTRTCFLSAERRGPGTGHPSNRLCHPESKRRGRNQSTPLISRSAEPTTHKTKGRAFAGIGGAHRRFNRAISVAIALLAGTSIGCRTVGGAHPPVCHESRAFLHR